MTRRTDPSPRWRRRRRLVPVDIALYNDGIPGGARWSCLIGANLRVRRSNPTMDSLPESERIPSRSAPAEPPPFAVAHGMTRRSTRVPCRGCWCASQHALGSVARGCQDQELELVSLAEHHIVNIGSRARAPNRVRHRRGAHHLVHHEARAVVSPEPASSIEAVAVPVGLRARMRVNRHRVAGCFLLPVASYSALRRRFLASIRRRCGLSHRPWGVVTFRSSRATSSVCRFPAARRESSKFQGGVSRHSDQRRVTLGRLRSAALFGSPRIARWASRCVHFAVCARLLGKIFDTRASVRLPAL